MAENQIDPEQLYTLTDAGKMKGYSPSRMRQLMDSNQLEGVRLSDGTRAIKGRSLAQFPAKRG